MYSSSLSEKGMLAWGQCSHSKYTVSRVSGRQKPWSMGTRSTEGKENDLDPPPPKFGTGAPASTTWSFLHTRMFPECLSVLNSLMSRMPILWTASTGNMAVPTSEASYWCSTNSWMDTSLERCLGWPWLWLKTPWVILAREVHGTCAKCWWSKRYAAASLRPASPTLTVGLSPGSPSPLPTKPLGLFGARGSSSVGFTTATFFPVSLLNT
mmetsp:Transcript_9143/g.26002  ORF Transcript_9143/g.26002 Transcript_9143/m.26002 type:complete len:210 (+) Transcript_9143:1021-1650(+)